MRDRSVVRLSITPSTKYSCSSSPPILTNGSTTIESRGAKTCAGSAPASSFAALDPSGALAKTVEGSAQLTDARWDAVITHVDLVTRGPGSATREDIEGLTAAGLSSHAIVSLSQLISFVNFQARVLVGLRMLKGAA